MGGEAGSGEWERKKVDESRNRRDPGCIVFPYLIHLFKARKLNNGVEEIPSHSGELCV